MLKRLAQNSYLILIFAFFYIPIGVLILYSFNDAQYSMVWNGFTLDWYRDLIENTGLITAAINSLTLATLASTIATIVGTIASISFFRYRFFGRKFLHGSVFLLILVPDIIMGIALLIAFNFAYIPLGFFSLLLAHITFCIPFVVLTVSSRISLIDHNLFEAAQDLGASEWRILSKVLLPLLFPAIFASFLLSFTLSLDDVMISYFVSGPGFEILPLKIFSLVRAGLKPEVNALCAVMFMVTLLLVLCAHYFLRKKV